MGEWTTYNGDTIVDHDAPLADALAAVDSGTASQAVYTEGDQVWTLSERLLENDSAKRQELRDLIDQAKVEEIVKSGVSKIANSPDVSSVLNSVLAFLQAGGGKSSAPQTGSKPMSDTPQSSSPAPDVHAAPSSNLEDKFLFEQLSPDEQGPLAMSILSTREGVDDAAMRKVLLDDVHSILVEMRLHMERWRWLSKVAVFVLVATLTISSVLAVFAIIALVNGTIDGYQVALVLFVLALFAVSPAVLLLLERPLKGIDEFQPSATKPSSGS